MSEQQNSNELLAHIDILTSTFKKDLDALLAEELATYRNNVKKAIESYINEVPKTTVETEEAALRQEVSGLLDSEF